MDRLWLCVEGQDEFRDLPYRKCSISARLKVTPAVRNMLENLRKLEIDSDAYSCWPCIKPLKKNQEKISMPNLVSLEIDNRNYQFLTVLGDHKIEQFTYNHKDAGETPESVFKEFFDKCLDLKRLKFVENFPQFNLSQYKFKLEALEVRGARTLPSLFVDFLRVQKDSLEEMCLDVCVIKRDVLNFIFHDANIKKLFNCNWNRPELDVGINHSIKFLALSNLMSQPQDFRLLEQKINRCRSLEILRLEFTSSMPKQILRLLEISMLRFKVVALSVDSMKNLKKISSWIRLNNFNVSFMISKYKVDDFLAKGICNGRLEITGLNFLVASSKGNLNHLQQLGRVKPINTFVQISSKSPGYNITLRNLSLHKQERNMKKISRARIFVENVVIYKSCKSFGDYFESSKLHEWDEASLEDYEAGNF